MSDSSEFDIIVYGATGFTGRLVAEYLTTPDVAARGVRWAMAGRSLAKLRAVHEELGARADVPTIAVVPDDAASLEAMARRTKVVLTTVGPYQSYGTPLVAACAATGTDYVDLNGEVAWMRQMIDLYQEDARTSGARIVFSCGFDSIPFEFGVRGLQRHAVATRGRAAARVKTRVREMVGTFSGGTLASIAATTAAARDPAVMALLVDPFALAPGFRGPQQPGGTKPEIDEDLGGIWVAPFVMAPINTRVVHRANFLQGHPYGTDFVYDEMMVAGPGAGGEATAKAIAGMMSGGPGPKPQPGEGPTKEQRDNGSYDVLFVGLEEGLEPLRYVVTGDRDPGYGSTSKIVSEAALCLAHDPIDVAGGMWTPGVALGDKLADRLRAHAGLTLSPV